MPLLKKHRASLLFALLLCVDFTETSIVLTTQSTTVTESHLSTLPFSRIPQSQSTLVQTDQLATQRWQLTRTEWQHYKQLMQGAAGRWYTHLDPPEVLGLLATTEAERAHYADLVVQQRKARIDHELAFNRAVHAAWLRAYPHLKPIRSFDARPFTVVKRK